MLELLQARFVVVENARVVADCFRDGFHHLGHPLDHNVEVAAGRHPFIGNHLSHFFERLLEAILESPVETRLQALLERVEIRQHRDTIVLARHRTTRS